MGTNSTPVLPLVKVYNGLEPAATRLRLNMRVKIASLTLLLILAAVSGSPARTQLQSVPKAVPNDQQPGLKIKSTVYQVATPVTVTDPSGEFVTGLEKVDFTVTDNGKRQEIRDFELTWQPLSLAIVVEASVRVEPLLPEIRKSGILFTQLVLGESGEAMVISFDHRVDIPQEFTKDGDAVEKALKGLKPGGSQARVTDAVFRAIGRLKMRPDDRRKVIVIIAEGRDMGSETRIGDAVREAQFSGIAVYSVELSTAKALLKKEPPPTTIDPFPAGAKPTHPGVPPVPQAASGMSLWPMIVEAVRGAKAIVFDKPLKVYAMGTGADHINVYTNKGIEEAVHKIGNELHSQYLITYNPDNLEKSDFHTIDVRVARPSVKVRARPGYFYVPTSDTTNVPATPKQ